MITTDMFTRFGRRMTSTQGCPYAVIAETRYTMTGGAPNVATDNTRLAGYSRVDMYSVPSLPYSAAGSYYYGS